MIEQTPPITPVDVPTVETVDKVKEPLSKKRRILIYIVGGILVLIASIAIGYFVGCNKTEKEEEQPINQEENIEEEAEEIEEEAAEITFKWPKVLLNNRVMFQTNSLFGYADPDGKNITNFNDSLSKTYPNLINSPAPYISPDGSKLWKTFCKTYEDEQCTDYDYYIASLDGTTIKEIDLEKIGKEVGENFKVRMSIWSQDSKSIVLIAVDYTTTGEYSSNFEGDMVDSPSANGKHIFLDFNTETFKYKKIFEKEKQIEPFFYDSVQRKLLYGDYSMNPATLVELATNKETTVDPFNPYNTGGSGQFYAVLKDDVRSFEIYSLLTPNQKLATITLDEPTSMRYSNTFLWSKNGKYVAVQVINKDNSFSDLLKIYDRTGKIIYSGNLSLTSGGVFSTDERYIIASTCDWSKTVPCDYRSWQAIEVATGRVSVAKFSNESLGQIFYWSK